MTTVDVHAFAIEAGQAMLRGEWSGTGSPVVPLHAGIGDRRMWDAHFAGLAENRRVVRIARAIDCAVMVRFPDAGHLPSLEDPVRFLRELDPFLSHAEDVVKRRHPVARKTAPCQPWIGSVPCPRC